MNGSVGSGGGSSLLILTAADAPKTWLLSRSGGCRGVGVGIIVFALSEGCSAKAGAEKVLPDSLSVIAVGVGDGDGVIAAAEITGGCWVSWSCCHQSGHHFLELFDLVGISKCFFAFRACFLNVLRGWDVLRSW